jgi:hypothetical protein
MKLAKILGLAVLGTGLLFTPVKKASADGLYVSADAGFDFRFGSNSMSVNYEESSYLPCTSLDATLGVGIKKDFSSFEIGLKGSWINAGFQHTLKGDSNSIPYEGPENWSWSPGAYAKIAYLLPKGDGVLSKGVFLEYSADFMQRIFQDEALKDKSNKLADAMSQTVKTGYEMKGKLNNVWITSDVFGGISFSRIMQLTDLGKASDLKFKPNFFIGYSLTVGLSSRENNSN